MAERNIRKEINDARIQYQDLRSTQAEFNGEMQSAENRMSFTKGQIDTLVRDGKKNTAAYRNLVKTYNEAKSRYEAAKAKFDEAKSKSDAAKKRVDDLTAEEKARVAAEKRKADEAKASEERKQRAGEAKSEAESLRQQAAVERDLGNTAEADRLEKEADQKESQAAGLSKPEQKKTGAPTVSTPAEATPVVAPRAPAEGSGYDYTHGKTLGAGQILWKDGNNWVARDQSYFFGPTGAVRTDRIAEVRKALQDAGYAPGKTLTDLSNNFRELIMQSASGGYSPLEAAKWNAEYGFGSAGGGTGGAGGGGSSQQYFKTIQTPQGLRDEIDKLYQATLKRNATWKEVVDATNFVNTQIDKNPYTVKQTAAGRTESGLTQGAVLSMLEQRIKKQPEYAEQVGQNFESWVEQKTGLKFATIANDPGIDAALRLYRAGNEVDALRALKNTETIKSAEASGLAGKTAVARDNLAKYAAAMGVSFDIDAAAQTIADGLAAEDDYKNQIKELAKSYYPAWAKQIDSGLTMQSIAYPYLNSMTQILELNPAEVNVNDPMIKKALTFRDKDGNATSQSIWDFEQTLRNDPRWAYTKNARTELDSVARSVLKDFGLAY